jgi:hypothetical protein
MLIDSVSSVNIFDWLMASSSLINVSVDVVRLTKINSYCDGWNGGLFDA